MFHIETKGCVFEDTVMLKGYGVALQRKLANSSVQRDKSYCLYVITVYLCTLTGCSFYFVAFYYIKGIY